MREKITEEIVQEYQDKREDYESFARTLKDLIGNLLGSEGLRYHSINYRIKECKSLQNKIISKNKYEYLNDITDTAGLRIITYYNDDVDNIAQLLEKEFMVDRDNTIDKRKALDPDRFGYLSLHYVVSMNERRLELPEYFKLRGYKAEVQIRSILQHTWAEIEHDLGYKSASGIPVNIKRDFSRLAGLLELADKEFREIRESLEKYSTQVNEQVNKESLEILIDKISLEVYFDSVTIVKEISQEIANLRGAEIVEADNNLFAVYAGALIKVGFRTIKQVHDELETSRSMISKVVDFMTHKEDDYSIYVSSAVSLAYLCYYKIGKTQNYGEIVKFLEGLKTGASKERCEEFARDLMKFTKSAS